MSADGEIWRGQPGEAGEAGDEVSGGRGGRGGRGGDAARGPIEAFSEQLDIQREYEAKRRHRRAIIDWVIAGLVIVSLVVSIVFRLETHMDVVNIEQRQVVIVHNQQLLGTVLADLCRNEQASALKEGLGLAPCPTDQLTHLP